jgi:hypothetical protein
MEALIKFLGWKDIDMSLNISEVDVVLQGNGREPRNLDYPTD